MGSDRQSPTGWERWDSGSTVRTGHSGRAQAEQSRTGAVWARLNKGLITAGKLFLKGGRIYNSQEPRTLSGAVFPDAESSIPMIDHYSRTCGEPEEVITVEKREDLACVHVRLKSDSSVLQTGKRQRLRHAKIVLVGMTADTARGRPKARLVALVVSSMRASRALQAQ